MRSLLAFTMSLAAVAAVAFAYPNPITLQGDGAGTVVRDPSICKNAAGTYFVFSTGTGLPTLTSTDLTTWTYAGLVFPDGASWTDNFTDPNSRALWAPDCTITSDGTFYLYYSASTIGSQNSAIFLATSSTGAPGSWTNKGLILQSSASVDWNAIDPNLIIDGSTWYLNFGSYWSGIKGVPVTAGTGVPTTTTYDSLAARQGSSTAEEGGVIFQDGAYYWLFSSWDADENYNVKVGRSSTLSSGYVDQAGVSMTAGGGTEVLASHDAVTGPGGQDLMHDTDGSVVIVYHYINGSGIDQLGINHVDFSGDFPVVT